MRHRQSVPGGRRHRLADGPLMMTETILLVDDDPIILRTLVRLLAPLTTAAPGTAAPPVAIQKAGSGMEAEAYLIDHPGCAVVVSDLRMPGMDGLALMERVRAVTPDSVRIMLTGNADVSSAIEAINQASIFRLLTKPCSGPALCMAVTDALKQHQLVISERQLLEQTLSGSMQVLVEMLSLIDPIGSSRALRIRRYVQHVIRTLSLQDTWSLDVAAMLSHLGSLTLATPDGPPPDNQPAHPSVGYELLKNIPRLDAVAGIIARQQDPIDPADAKVSLIDQDPTRRGGYVLRVAIEFDASIVSGVGREVTLIRMRNRPADFARTVVDSMRNAELPEHTFEARTEAIADLRVGMILDEDLRNASGLLIMPRGLEITRPLLLRLRATRSDEELRRVVQVLAPRG